MLCLPSFSFHPDLMKWARSISTFRSPGTLFTFQTRLFNLQLLPSADYHGPTKSFNNTVVWGQCTHVFHMHCLLKWLNTESSKEQCPLDRRPWGESLSAL
jgi:hypothetical protein